jgi:hypothetical protein
MKEPVNGHSKRPYICSGARWTAPVYFGSKMVSITGC